MKFSIALLCLVGLIIPRGFCDDNATAAAAPSNVPPVVNYPEGYVKHFDDGMAYKVYKEYALWAKAAGQCILDGARLTVTDTSEKLSSIMGLQHVADTDVIHVGILKLKNANTWVSVDNNRFLPSLPWAARSYKPEDNERCGGVEFGRGLVNYHCEKRMAYYVCEMPIAADVTSMYLTEGMKLRWFFRDSPVKSAMASVPYFPDYVKLPDDTMLYKIHNTLESWVDARDICVREGAVLATVTSQAKFERLKTLKPNLEADKVIHVGIVKSSSTNRWERVDGEFLVTGLPWAPNRPSDSGNCASMSFVNNGLVDFPCVSDKQYFICEKQGSPDEVTVIPPDNCIYPRTGYIRQPDLGVAYKIVEMLVDRQTAHMACKAENANLANPDTVQKVARIKSMRYGINPGWVAHVGIHFSHASNTWVRGDTELAVSPVPWAVGRPSHQGMCTAVTLTDDGLVDYPCIWMTAYYVCEIPI